jgi:hypothetical protein
VAFSNDPDHTETTLTRLGRRHWLYPVPAVALHAITLVVSPKIWTDIVTGSTRSGHPTRSLAAHSSLLISGLLLVGYYAIPFVGSVMLDMDWRASFARSSPTDKGCALALVRGGLLFALYAIVWSYARKYLFGGA